MIKLSDCGTYVLNRNELIKGAEPELHINGRVLKQETLRKNTLAYKILESHNESDDMKELKLKFDSITSHDLTYVNVVQTAKASGLDAFPVPYILTNCHNSLCAVGGTLNEDDHVFGLSVAKKYGGIYVPAHQAVIHQYMREMHAVCGAMILGSDSHTRYGALGTLAIGEGGGELVKQLLSKTYDIPYPEVIGVHLTGKPRPGVGPQDVALAIIRAVFKNGFVTNKIMEFFGDGIDGLSVDFRNGIDVMTTETTCLSSIWETDDLVKRYYDCHQRPDDYREMKLSDAVYYDGMIEVDLSQVEAMIALPFHPSNAYAIRELYENLEDILRETEKAAVKLYADQNVSLDLLSKVRNGKFYAEQGVIAGCAGGTYENIMESANILNGNYIGNDLFSLSVYPSSQPVMLEISRHDVYGDLLKAGVTMRTAFCGPCFGAGDVPANGCLSLRHTTRNFPNREGSKPGQGQLSGVALMDARSIAATALNGGAVTAATDIDYDQNVPEYHFDRTIYEHRVYNGFQKPVAEEPLRYGPNIVDWPEFGELENHLLLKVCSFIEDPVTTTDELIPSGDTATFRSNPAGLAEFTLSRKDPEYVGRAKWVQVLEQQRRKGRPVWQEMEELTGIYGALRGNADLAAILPEDIGLGSVIYAIKPGDGSAREQAASCQRVLGGCANISVAYATKRYRSNLVNWGMIPFILEEKAPFAIDDYILIPDIRTAIKEGRSSVTAYVIREQIIAINLLIGELTDSERQIIMDGCLINYYKNSKA